MATARSSNRQRLGAAIARDRIGKGWRKQHELAEAAGVSVRLVGNAERGEKVSDSYLHKIELALEWPPGSVDRALATGEVPSVEEALEHEAAHRRAEILTATHEQLVGMRNAVEEVLGREQADAFMVGALRLREEAGKKITDTGRSAS